MSLSRIVRNTAEFVVIVLIVAAFFIGMTAR